MGNDILLLALFCSAYGALYPCVVGGTLGMCMLFSRRFRPSVGQWAALSLPALLYYFLHYVVMDRQGFNIGYAVPMLAGSVAAMVVIAALVRRPSWLYAVSALGVAIGFSLWRLVPSAHMTRLF